VRVPKGQEVSLGCGSLILIGLIVLICSGGVGRGDLDREVRGLRAEVGELKKVIETQTDHIKALEQKVAVPAKAR
jgi:hypothetical protein